MTEIGGVAVEQLRSFIERIERLEEEKAAIAADIREVYAQAKGDGFDPKTMRQICRIRKMEANDREEEEFLLDTYKRALGLAPDMDAEPVANPGAVNVLRDGPEGHPQHEVKERHHSEEAL